MNIEIPGHKAKVERVELYDTPSYLAPTCSCGWEGLTVTETSRPYSSLVYSPLEPTKLAYVFGTAEDAYFILRSHAAFPFDIMRAELEHEARTLFNKLEEAAAGRHWPQVQEFYKKLAIISKEIAKVELWGGKGYDGFLEGAIPL